MTAFYKIDLCALHLPSEVCYVQLRLYRIGVLIAQLLLHDEVSVRSSICVLASWAGCSGNGAISLHFHWYVVFQQWLSSSRTIVSDFRSGTNTVSPGTGIAGKFGKEFNLANWRGIERIAKLKIAEF